MKKGRSVYLKSLTLKGFKSFAQPTTFTFEPGVTCIVGPNGSGKSNVVDALAWVMGEQGAKTLRGGKMEDVIFAGTATRGPLGRAEVSLTIDNSDNALPIEYTEVTLTRTLFRNGASEYAINGEACRLLDVQELLNDSGLGREMHVIVGQGQLDQVLRATAEERRGFIEEAAGILKHRRRKEKTVRKLEGMQANLTRLSDLAGELRRQLKPLGRQAEVAREAETIAAVARDARARLFADEVATLRTALADLNSDADDRAKSRVDLETRLEAVRITAEQIEAESSSEAFDRARSTSRDLELVSSDVRSLESLARQRIELLQGESGIGAPILSVTPTMVDDSARIAEELNSELMVASESLEAAVKHSGERRASLEKLDEEVAQQSALISAYELRISQLVGRVQSTKSELETLGNESARQESSLKEANERHAAALKSLALAESEALPLGAGDTNLDEEYEAAQGQAFEAEADLERLRDSLHEAEREHGAVQAHIQALNLALGQPDGSSALISARLPGVAGAVADNLRVREGYEAAIAAALGPFADAVLVETLDAGLTALAHAAKEDLGRIDVAVANAPAYGGKPLSIAGLTPATKLVKAPPGVLGILAEVYVAENLAAVSRAQTELQALERPVTVITKDGAVVGRYILRGAKGRKQSRIELAADRDRASARLEELRSRIDQEQSELVAKRALVEEAKLEAQSKLAALREFDAHLAQRTEGLNRVRVEADAIAGEVERLKHGYADSRNRVEAATASVAEAEEDLRVAQAQPPDGLDRTARDAAEAELEAARESEVEARLRLETVRERLRGEETRLRDLRSTYEAERIASLEAARRAVVRRAQADAAGRVAAVLPALISAVDASLSEAMLELAQAEVERNSRNEKLLVMRRDENTLRAQLQQVTDAGHSSELRSYEKSLQLTAILERAESMLSLDEATLLAEYGPSSLVSDIGGEAVATAFVREEQERRLERAEKDLELLGRVNPLALEEFKALEQRHTYLVEQLADLTKTRADLVSIIADIDEMMQAVFASAFEDTKAAFAEVFPVLFPGGTGSISLTDPNDLLTTGVEVQVKPAGKKIERLSLLSGGERSLAAIALLMAIFKARPSPFYIMDEVEAALDDINLGRLLTTFEGLRESSQLVVITHQKRTMEIADALYGVSMRQDGVSAVVGQRIREEGVV